MEAILRADSLYHIYESNAEDGNVVALRGLSVSIRNGEAVAVVGPSGSGKSTLLKCLGALMKPSAGSVELVGRRVTRLTGSELVSLRQQTVSFIFQDSNLLPHLNALNNVAQPLLHQGELARPSRKKAQALLDRLGVGDRALGMPEQLSGGEQQRVAIARALITNPKLILADEPTGPSTRLRAERCSRYSSNSTKRMASHSSSSPTARRSRLSARGPSNSGRAGSSPSTVAMWTSRTSRTPVS